MNHKVQVEYLKKKGILAVAKSKERIVSIQSIVGEDEKALSLLGDALERCIGYVTVVYNMETTIDIQKFKAEGDELRETRERFDRLRRLAHNSLIDSIIICNRYLFKVYGAETIPVGGIYSADPNHLAGEVNRAAIGDWACQVVVDYFEQRKK